jgi:hypothetical protein
MGDMQGQLQLNEQLQEMCIEYKDLCDQFLSILATAENMVKEAKKKYSHWDEFDSSSHKTDNGLALQFLRLLKIFKENRSDFMVEYKNNQNAYENNFLLENGSFNLPKKIDLETVQEKVNLWKSLTDNNDYKEYFEEIINVLNYNCKLEIDKEKQKYYKTTRSDEQKKQHIKNIMKVKACKKEEDDKVTDEVAETGNYEYEPQYYDKPGRWRF